MHNIINRLLALSAFLLLCLNVQASHNRAGNLQFTHISGYTYQVCIYTYTDSRSVAADRNSLPISWGDGLIDTLQRSVKTIIAPYIQYNVYCGIHTYSGPGCYAVTMTDPNRVANIINIGNGSTTSFNTPFCLEDTLCIKDPNFFGYDNSPIITNPPVDQACVNELFQYNPGAYDPDGDSLVYSLMPPIQAPGLQVPGYVDPSTIGAGSNNVFSINRITGTVTWNTPQRTGIYNIAILIREYRKIQGTYYSIGSIELDMEIIVNSCSDHPPVVKAPNDTCIIAGSTLIKTITASDPDPGQYVTLAAYGSPFSAVAPATAIFDSTSGVQSATSKFTWVTNCAHIQSTPYIVIFKAHDDFVTTDNVEIYLADIVAWHIRVVAPPVDSLTGSALGNTITLKWHKPYTCAGTPTFIGFSVWRRLGCPPFTPDVCNTGNLKSLGFIELDSGLQTYTYKDNTPQPGFQYQYVVQADFGVLASSSALGTLYYNTSSGLASESVCLKLSRDLPVITNVSVDSTHKTAGKIFVAWTKPHVPDLDTTIYPPPYRYDLYRAITGTNTFTLAHSYNENTFYSANDTTYEDTALNTVNNQYQYYITFLSIGHDTGSTKKATSVFATASGAANTDVLKWKSNVPWIDSLYVIYRKAPGSTKYDSLTTVHSSPYFDEQLINDSTYCYYVKAIGHYTAKGIKDPLINLSERICVIPADTLGPCPTVLSVQNPCTDKLITTSENLLTWQDVNLYPLDTAKLCTFDRGIKYLIYYKPLASATFNLLTTVNNMTDTTFAHIIDSTLTGCYAVRVVDSAGKLSAWSNIVCMDNCPDYILPNAFTPNGDGHNDIYHPIYPYKYVDHVNMNIFNRWGELVFTTHNKDIGWNGDESNTGKQLPDGVYYYTCDVFTYTNSGVQKWATLTGFIHLVR